MINEILQNTKLPPIQSGSEYLDPDNTKNQDKKMFFKED